MLMLGLHLKTYSDSDDCFSYNVKTFHTVTVTDIIPNIPRAVEHNELTFYKHFQYKSFDTIYSVIMLCLIFSSGKNREKRLRQ